MSLLKNKELLQHFENIQLLLWLFKFTPSGRASLKS
jgi:hypothetical protein